MLNDQQWAQFKRTAESLMTDDMDGLYRAHVISDLGKVAPEKWDNFVIIAESLMTPDMNGENRAWVIEALGGVPAEKIDRVYGQIQRLMQETEGKIKLEREGAARELIHQLRDCTSDDQAVAFTNDLIARVNDVLGNIDDNALLTHITAAWERVRGGTQNELQELARQGQSTHKKEVHASVAESVKRLQEKYKDQLPQDDVLELTHAAVMSVFPQNFDFPFNRAVLAGKLALGSEVIDNLLKISPHARAGENDEDTELNVAARALQADKSLEVKKAIQKLVYYHSHKSDLTDALELLSYIKGLPSYRESYTGLSYIDLLRLITAATQDEKSRLQGGTISAQDIKDRWLSLMTRMARARNEYRENRTACLAGIFNALLEPLSQVHPDVRIINSFRAMMQEISAEEDDDEFERRIQVALSYLGENAAKDPDYRSDIQAFSDARIQLIAFGIEDPELSKKYLKRREVFKFLESRKRLAHGQIRKRRSKSADTQWRIAQEALRDEKAVNKKQSQRIKHLRGLPQRISQDLEVR